MIALDPTDGQLKWFPDTAGISGVSSVNGQTGAITLTPANLGATTIGASMFGLANPGAITFPRFNADNSVTALNALNFRTAIGAGTSSFNGTFSALSGVPTSSDGYLGPSSDRGIDLEVWISVRQDGRPGSGTAEDPFDGSSADLFDGVMTSFFNNSVTNILFHLGPGIFQTNPLTRTWYPLSGWTFEGTGMYSTTIQTIVASTLTYGATVIASPYNVFTNNVTLRLLTLDANWGGIANYAQEGATVRTFSGTTASSSPTVTCTSATLFDIGRRITGTGIPPNSWIGTVVEGVSIGLSSSAVSNVPVNATTSATNTLTISEKNTVVSCATLLGNYNTYDRVRAIGAFGSLQNGVECFVLALGATYTSTAQDSTNGLMTRCLVELCYGNYANPFSIGGNEGAPSASYPGVLNILENSTVEFCRAIGTRGKSGFSVPGSVSAFTSGGVNLGGHRNTRIYGNQFIDCPSIAYQDTGTCDGIVVSNNTLVRGRQGIAFVVDPHFASSVTIAGSGTGAVNGLYYYTGIGFNGKLYYNLTGHPYSTSNYSLHSSGSKWVITNSTGVSQYESTNNPTHPWDATGWAPTGGAAGNPTLTENKIVTRGITISKNLVGCWRGTIGGANYGIVLSGALTADTVIDSNTITYDGTGPGDDTFWAIQTAGMVSGQITNNVIDDGTSAPGGGHIYIGVNGSTDGAPDPNIRMFGNRKASGARISTLPDVLSGSIDLSGFTLTTNHVLGRQTAGTGAIELLNVNGTGNVVLEKGATLSDPNGNSSVDLSANGQITLLAGGIWIGGSQNSIVGIGANTKFGVGEDDAGSPSTWMNFEMVFAPRLSLRQEDNMLGVVSNSSVAFSVDRLLNIDVADADRTLALLGNLTIGHNIILETDGTGTRTLNIGAGGTLGTAAFTAASAYDAAGAAAAVVSDTAYDATSWNGVTTIAPSKNAVRDKVEAMISSADFGGSWNGVITIAPSKSAVYDKIITLAASGVNTDITSLALTLASTDKITDAGTTTTVNPWTISHNSSGTAAAGFGVGLKFALSSTTTADQDAGQVSLEWATATHASRKARGKLIAYDTAARECLRFEASGSAAMLGLFGHAAAVQPSAYTPTNVTTDRSFDADSTTIDELADILGTLIADLQSFGALG